MQPAYEIPQFTPTASSASEIDADVLAIPVPQELAAVDWIDGLTGDGLSKAVARRAFAGKPAEHLALTISDPGWRTTRLLAIGVGPRAELGADRARRFGATLGLWARQHKLARVAVALDGAWPDALTESVVEGMVLANYDNGHHKRRHDGRFFVAGATIAGGAKVGEAVERGVRVGEAVNAARLLINEPGNCLTPSEFVARGQSLLSLPDVTLDTLDEGRLAELGMGLLLGVAKGSAEPPRMLVARYEPAAAPPAPVLALVGKGITFDTGGISLKPADGMERMKDDMAGGASVMAALRVIATERLPLRVIAVVPSTENMPGGKALKPGDVITGAAGLSVEVNNTDAEGRLILGDALWYARELGATHIIDVATLTGACVVALGKSTTGLFGTNGWVELIQEAAARAGERVWPMPLFEEYKESLKSEIADLLNSPGRPAGAVTAAMFLKEFVPDGAWAHLDIAGTAWADDARPWAQKGATGVMIRTLVEVARGLVTR